MKKLILILFLLPLFAVGQSRFEEEFTKADSAFVNQAKEAAIMAAIETDGIFYKRSKKSTIDHIMKVEGKDSIKGCCSRTFYNCLYEIEKSNKVKNILISENDYLDEYMNGYMIGQLSFYYNKGFNYDILELKLKKIKRELRKVK